MSPPSSPRPRAWRLPPLPPLSLHLRIGLVVFAAVLAGQFGGTVWALGLARALAAEPVAVLLAAGVALLTALVTARLVAGPVRALAATTRALAAGDLGRRTGIRRGDEIGRLAADLDALADALRARESAVRESERRLEALLAHGSDLLGIVDAAGVVRYQSPSSARVLGVPPAAIVGTPVTGWVHPDERLSFAALLGRARATPGQPLSAVTRVPHANGSYRWVEVTVTAALDDPAIGGYVLSGVDATDRIAHEGELRRAAARTRALLAALPDLIFVLDPAGVFVEYHAPAEHFAAVSPEACIGRHFTEVLPAAVAEHIGAAIGRLRTSGRPQTVEYALGSRGQRGEFFEARLAAVGTGGVILAIRDITERKKAEAALRESELKFRRLAESTASAIVIYDAERVFYVNPAAEQLTGYPADVLLTMPPYALAVPADREALRRSAEARLRGSPEPARREFRIVRRDGSVRWIDLAVGVTEVDGRPVNVGTAYDITERKAAEAALQQLNRDLEVRVGERTRQLAVANERLRAEIAERERAEAALRERTAQLEVANVELARAARLKDDFLASMSHELRTPLNAILGLAEALQEQVYGPLDERQLRCLRTIEESGRDLLGLISDILDLSKIGADRLRLEPGTVDVDALCTASLAMVRDPALRKGHRLSLTIDPAVRSIRADERRVKQVLVNLLSNAVKFTPPGGRIGVDVAGDPERQVIRFVVWDTGIGIAPEDMGRLFEPFVQLDSRLSRQHPGTGLGLSLVHRLVDLHGGSVAVESTVGQGTRFTVTLPWTGRAEAPAAGPPAAPAAAAAVPPPAADGPLVLIADDNAPTREVMGDVLAREGFRVLLAEDGHEALAHARATSPALILVDVQMPGLDGLKVIRRLRALAEVAAVPIVAITALVRPGDRERCLAAGATAYLSKPVGLRDLAATARQLTRRV